MSDPLAIIIIVSHITATVALFNGFITVIGQSRVAVTALEAIARQPEAADSVRGTMFIALGMCETNGIYGLLLAFIMLFANPLITIYLENAIR